MSQKNGLCTYVCNSSYGRYYCRYCKQNQPFEPTKQKRECPKLALRKKQENQAHLQRLLAKQRLNQTVMDDATAMLADPNFEQMRQEVKEEIGIE